VANSGAGRLYVVATPIGNLGDMSPRACDVLRSVALVAAEDTRHSGALLHHFGITTPLVSFHEHNDRRRTPELVLRLQGGADIALISDAGSPAISDPGFELVAAAAAAGVEVVAIPGPCALVAALTVAALPTDRFCFEGFLPARSAARRARLEALAGESRSIVCYESPHRIADTLADCRDCFGAERRVSIARELTKLHETVYRGTLGELAARAQSEPELARGELVIVLAGAAPRATDAADAELDRTLELLLAELPLKQAARLAAQLLGVRDNEAYKRALQLKHAADSQ
jgi:16S rRNA (cytidine1402-2'-O)-methyltransferase